jgi:hypothetical protein
MRQRHEKTVLFLCTGNYYRSRFAEALFNSVAGRMGLPWRASSRGLALGSQGSQVTLSVGSCRGTGYGRAMSSGIERSERRGSIRHTSALAQGYFPHCCDAPCDVDIVPSLYSRYEQKVVTAGTFDATTTPGNAYGMTREYVTTGRTPDGTLVMTYLPSLRTGTLDLSQLHAPATARWYDSSRGTYSAINGSPFKNAGK